MSETQNITDEKISKFKSFMNNYSKELIVALRFGKKSSPRLNFCQGRK